MRVKTKQFVYATVDEFVWPQILFGRALPPRPFAQTAGFSCPTRGWSTTICDLSTPHAFSNEAIVSATPPSADGPPPSEIDQAVERVISEAHLSTEALRPEE